MRAFSPRPVARLARPNIHFLLAAAIAGASPALSRAETQSLILGNPGAETGTTSSWTVGGTSNPGVDNGTFDAGITPFEGFKDFYGGTGASGTLSQTLSLDGFAPTFEQIDAGQVQFKAAFVEQSLGQSPADAAGVNITTIPTHPTSPQTFSSPAFTNVGGWANGSVTNTLPTFTRQIQYQMAFSRNSGNDLDAFIDANSLTLTYPGSSWVPSANSMGTTYNWSNNANWNSNVPLSGAPALLSIDGAGANVSLDTSYSAAAPLTDLYVDALKNPMTLNQSANQMNAGTEYIGNAGKGAYVQTGGSNTAGLLLIGVYAGSAGTYSISNGTLSATTLKIADLGGSGSFTSSGSANVTASTLLMGSVVSGTDGLFVNGGNVTAGSLSFDFGSELIAITAGNLTISNFINIAGSTTYQIKLSGGTFSVPAIPFADPTHFNWTGGALVVHGNVTIDANGSFAGNLSLSNGQTFNAAQLTNNGTISTSAPSLLLTPSLQNTGTLSAAGDLSITSTGPVENDGFFTASGNFQCAGTFFNHGTATFSGKQTWSLGAAFHNDNSATFLSDAGSPTNPTLVVSNDQGALSLHGLQHLKGLLTAAGATTALQDAAVQTGDYSLAGTLTLSNATLVVQNPANKSATMTDLRTGVTNGLTSPTGIQDPTLPPRTALAVLDNAVTGFTSFDGLSVDATSILLAPELLGDANADGKVDLSDLSTILNHFGTTTPNWTDGNFDNAITIDLTDLSDVLNNFGATTTNTSAQLPTSNYQLLSSPTPEPLTLSLLLPITLLLRHRRAK